MNNILKQIEDIIVALQKAYSITQDKDYLEAIQQLTIFKDTILRIVEKNKAPILPNPTTNIPPNTVPPKTANGSSWSADDVIQWINEDFEVYDENELRYLVFIWTDDIPSGGDVGWIESERQHLLNDVKKMSAKQFLGHLQEIRTIDDVPLPDAKWDPDNPFFLTPITTDELIPNTSPVSEEEEDYVRDKNY